jgi:hypothetical protein
VIDQDGRSRGLRDRNAALHSKHFANGGCELPKL